MLLFVLSLYCILAILLFDFLELSIILRRGPEVKNICYLFSTFPILFTLLSSPVLAQTMIHLNDHNISTLSKYVEPY